MRVQGGLFLPLKQGYSDDGKKSLWGTDDVIQSHGGGGHHKPNGLPQCHFGVEYYKLSVEAHQRKQRDLMFHSV